MKFKSLIAALISISAFSAQAAIIDPDPNVYAGSGSVLFDFSDDRIEFGWTGTPVSLGLEFTSDTAFSLSFDAFVSNGSLSDVTGFTLDLIDGIGGTAITRYTIDTDFCDSAASQIAGDCNLIAVSGAMGGNAGLAYQPGETIFDNLAAGTYRFGLYDSATPTSATATFTYSEVSAPATALLMLMGLGGMALRRRSR